MQADTITVDFTAQVIAALVAVIASTILRGLIAVQNVVSTRRCLTHFVDAVFARAVSINFAPETWITSRARTTTINVSLALVLNGVRARGLN